VKDLWFDTDYGKTEYTQWSVEGFVAGDVMELPAGPLAIAFGLHYQQDEILDTPGAATLAGTAWGASSAGITAGEDTTSAVFAEVQVPLISDVALVEQLDFSGSVRYTDVESYGSDTTYKVGLNWSLTDEVRMRSTFGTSFRTPALYELYLARQTSFPLTARSSDICINWGSELADGNISQEVADNCAADGLPPDFLFTVSPTVVTGGGQGVLVAETSDAFTAGIIWTPSFAELSISVDYFDIEVFDEVDVIGALNIVTGCYTSDFFPNEPLCDLFDRSPGGAAGVIPGSITEIRDSYINVSRQHNRGLDFQIQYTTDFSFGTLLIDSQQTLQFEDTLGLFDTTEEDRAGEAGHPEWVGNLNFTFMRGPWSFFWGITYIGETENYDSFGFTTAPWYDDTEVDLDLKAESRLYHSVSGTREFGSGYLARFGVANAFDEEPPRMSSYTTGAEVDILGEAAFYSQYDWFGRRFFVELSKTF
jgi:iron complex outermembrane receptor protein